MKLFNADDRQMSSLSGAFVFVLMGVFALFCVIMVLISAGLFKSVYRRTEAETEKRILYNYIGNAVRASDRSGAVTVRENGGVKALVLSNTEGDNVYENSIYLYEGALREIYLEKDSEFHPEYGEIIAPAEGFDAAIENGLLTVSIVSPGGESRALRVYLKAGGEGEAP